MKKREILNSMSLIDEKYVEEAAPYNAKPFVIFKKKGLRRAVLLAASLCLLVAILVGTIIGEFLKKTPEETPDGTPKEPEFVEGPLYTYEEFSQLMAIDQGNLALGVPTNNYTKTTVKDLKALRADSLPFDEPALIYNYISIEKGGNENELKKFTDPIVERYCKMVNESVPSYVFEQSEKYGTIYAVSGDMLSRPKIGNQILGLYQYTNRTTISFSAPMSAYSIEQCLLSLDGIIINVDQRKNDDEIEKDMIPIKEKLFELFGVEFSDVKISRVYNKFNRLQNLDIYFYNKTDHELNSSLEVLSDHIYLKFDNSSPDIATDDVLYNVSVVYEKYRSDPYERCYATKKVNLLDLKIAEEYLSKGYVIGGYACPLCTASQEKIDFENYDFVCIRYQVCKNVVIPFYNFYKHLEGDTYALTSVPAIEIEGYAEHFEQVQSNHEHKTQ